MLFRYMYMPTNMADGVSNKVEIKTGKGEIPVKYCYDEKSQLKEMEKENYQNSPDTDKTKLHGELLEQCQHELQTVREKLRKTEDELEESNNCNRELRDEVDKLNTQLRQLKNATKDKSDAESQTDASLLHGDIDGFKYLDGLSKDQAIVINDSVDEGHEHQTVEDTKLAKGGDTESAETHGDKETDMGAATKESATVKSNGESKDNDIKMESDDKKEKEDKQEEGSSVSLADELRATAEAVVQQTGYVYDENSGLYYDYNSGYYYNAEKALYYDPKTGTYFYYNSESGKYEFHSQVDVSQYSTTQGYNYNYSQNRDHYPRGGNYDTPPQRDYYSSHRDSGYDQHHRVLPRRDRDTPRSSSKSYIDHHTSHRSDRRDNDKKKKSKRLQAEEMDKEDYEEVITALEGLKIKTAKETALEMVSKWPPCIRMIVTDSDIIDPGTLFIVTCTGATVGREKEMGHTILIPDINISKAHAEIHFDEAEYQYFLIDLASQNGTFLNEERISEPKVKSKPKALGHGDTLQFGCTRLLLHIHEGMDTCDECEPGQVQAQLQAQNQQPKEIVILSKEEKLRQQKQQLKKIKKKYGLKNSAYEDNMSAINNSSYSDKAEERRKTVGSDNPYQPDEAPASVHRPISEDNKGHKMLKKLGWSEGESLGKDNEGIRQPISVKFRANKSAGLGAGGAGEGSVEAVGDLHRRQKWLEVQQRYNQMEVDKTTANKSDKKTLTAPKWVQGETQEG